MRARKHTTFAVIACLSLLTGACGARLTQAQMDAANRSQTGVGVGSGSGAGSSGGTGGAESAVGSGPAAVSGSGTGPSGGAATGGAAAGGSAAGASAGSTGGAAAASGGKVCPSGGASHDPGVSASEIDVGNVSTLTGPIPGLFVGAQRGTQAFAAYQNSVGGVCGRKLVVKSADDNLDASQNATATQSLANQVLAFVGSFSVDDQGGAAALQQGNVPDIGEALSSQRFNLATNFSPQPEPVGWNIAPYIYFKQKYPQAITKMAYFTENNSTAEQEGLAEVQALKSIGYNFIYHEDGIEPTQTNFDAEARAMQQAGVQGIVFQATASVYADMAKSLYNIGYKIPFADYGAPAYDPAFTSSAGPAANGAVLTQSVAMYGGEDAASVPEVALFDKWYEALYHTTPDLFAAYGWMSGMLFVQGINAGGAPTRAALLSGLKSIQQFTAGGLVATDNPAKKTPAYCWIVIDVTNGKFVRDPGMPATGFDCANTPNYFLTSA
ncbi:MAG TPA: ABC transporter substrate-binding protein [Acidimicrobiales bacterium]|nr:ABC transporter substrate-binding protein [Acidimicrobiales bacterium]